MIFQAHRGLSSDLPENTIPAFKSAVDLGYGMIELDVRYTSDGEFILLHDPTVNRTGRYDDGEIIKNEVFICDMPLADAKKLDFGLWFGKRFKGTHIAELSDVLKFAKENDIKLKIDNQYAKFPVKMQIKLFDLIKPFSDVARITCQSIDDIEFALAHLPDARFHYDGLVTPQILEKLSRLLSKDRITVWMPIENDNTSWVKVPFANEENCKAIKCVASLGLWLLSDEKELEMAVKLGADVIETNGTLKPFGNVTSADMHTHSEYSHDSVCPIKDMKKLQTEKGTSVFAVTDHCDVFAFDTTDIYTPIKKSVENAKAESLKCGNTLVLSGVEISEGFWYPDQLRKVENLCHYDAVIGSVHCVDFYGNRTAYSRIDFGKFSDDEIYDYLRQYFDDVLTVVTNQDIDIMAHLTCPLRYIVGKFGRNVDLSRFDGVIEKILKTVIDRGIAFEVNTSGYRILKDFMPPVDVIKRYYSLGGRLVTIGSDAHLAENASFCFDEAKKMLKDIGFYKLYYFVNRIPYSYKI